MDDDRLREIYYNPESVGSFGGVSALAKAAGVSKKVAQKWLLNEFAYTLHKPARRRFVTRPYRTNKIDSQWQSDLVEMIEFQNENDGNKYLLTTIDLFSRYAWARPLESKHGKVVTAAFRSILDEGRKPMALQTDEGLEFENRYFQHMLNVNNIKFFTVNSHLKAAVVERWNRTLKGRMYRYFTHSGTHRWVDVLPKLVSAYNASIHRSIGIAPRDVNADNEIELWDKQQHKRPQQVTARDKHSKFNIGDNVRISFTKLPFDKAYLPLWTDQVYTISRIINTPKIGRAFAGPLQYKIRDYNGEEIQGSFYGFELQKIAPPQRYRIEQVLRQRVRNGRVQYFVKWMGYGPEFNSWVDNIENI